MWILFSFSRCLAKARIAAVSLCSLAELDSVTRVKKNEECIMSVVNPGIPRVKVTDPTVLSIKELISRGELNPSNSQGPKRASHPFVRWTSPDGDINQYDRKSTWPLYSAMGYSFLNFLLSISYLYSVYICAGLKYWLTNWRGEKLISKILSWKRGRGVSRPSKKFPGLFDFFSSETLWSWDLQGLQILSCSILSWDLLGTS